MILRNTIGFLCILFQLSCSSQVSSTELASDFILRENKSGCQDFTVSKVAETQLLRLEEKFGKAKSVKVLEKRSKPDGLWQCDIEVQRDTKQIESVTGKRLNILSIGGIE